MTADYLATGIARPSVAMVLIAQESRFLVCQWGRDCDSMSDLKFEKLLKHLYGFSEKLAGANSRV